MKSKNMEEALSKESLEQELERCRQELDSFIYVASHDLKTPLRAICAMAQMVREDYDAKLDDDAKDSLDEIFSRSMRMNKLIEAMLEYHKIGKLNTEIDEFDPLMVIVDAIDSLDIPENINIEIVNKDSFPSLRYNDVGFDQVITNLISNAVEHARLGDDGLIQISYEDQGDFHKFNVEDNGIGISPEHHERIFLIFQSMSVLDRVKNVGVGLTSARKIVQHFGGEITVESELNKGSKFSFTIPKNL